MDIIKFEEQEIEAVVVHFVRSVSATSPGLDSP
jgi:hypothetical protein